MTEELERLRKSLGGELVPYGAYEPEKLQPGQGATRIPIAGSADGLRRRRQPPRCGGGEESRRSAMPSIVSKPPPPPAPRP